MQKTKRSSGPLTRVLISLFLFTSVSIPKAFGGSPYIVEAQANNPSAGTTPTEGQAGTPAASSNPMEPQGNTLQASTTPVEGQGNTPSAAVTGVSMLPEVKVTAHGIDQAAAFNEMHESPIEVNVLSQDQINQTPAKTVAEAAQQLPGVSVQHDEGEPVYIQIRGTDENLDITTYNGVLIPSYDEGLRSVDLDDIPAGLFGELQLFKQIMPDMDAQGIGGQLNLVPKSAFDYPDNLFEIKAEAGYVPERNYPTFAGQFTWAQNVDLGGTSNLGVLVSSMYDDKRFGLDDLEETWSTTNNPLGTYLGPRSINQYSLRREDYDRSRAGIGANIDLSFDKNDKLFYTVMYSGYDEWRDPKLVTNLNNIDAVPGGTSTLNPDGSFTVAQADDGFSIEDELTNTLKQDRTLAMALGGENDMNGFSLDYKTSFAYAQEDEPTDWKYEFKDKAVGGDITYNNSTNNGNSPEINLSQVTGYTASNFYLSSVSNDPNWYNVNQYGAQADGKVDTPLADDVSGALKFGAAGRTSYAVYAQTSYEEDPLSKTALALSQDGVEDPNDYNFYPGGIYNLGPAISMSGIENAVNGPNAFTTAWYQPDPLGDQGADWNSYETILAGYAMYTVTSGKMTVIGGARVEGTLIHYNWNSVYGAGEAPVQSNETGTVTPESGNINYVDVLPSLSLKYAFNDIFDTRVNYTETLARPTYVQYIPAATIGSDVPGTDQEIGATYGNPNLKPMVSDNYDWTWEIYPEKGAIMAVDGFLKDISNYIAPDYQIFDEGGDPAGLVTYSNIPGISQIYGLEFQYQQQYTFLAAPFDGLGIRASLSRCWSQGETSPGVETSLPSQSDLVWNAGIFYKKGGLTIDVGGAFTGANIYQLGDQDRPASDGGPVPNTWYDDYFQIDAKVQYAFSKTFSIYVDGWNLNNAPLRFYQDPNSSYPEQEEFYQPSFDGGMIIDL